MRKGSIFVVSAASGSGKTTICRKLLERVEDLELSVSYTTRLRKRGEADGVDYYFITPEVFDKMINSKVFLEHAFVHGNRYGTSRETVESVVSRGKDALLEIDVQGGRMVKEAVPGAVIVAIFPPDREALERRLAGRGRETREEMDERMKAGDREGLELRSYEHHVVNDDLETAVSQVESIIRAHRSRQGGDGRLMGPNNTSTGEE